MPHHSFKCTSGPLLDGQASTLRKSIRLTRMIFPCPLPTMMTAHSKRRHFSVLLKKQQGVYHLSKWQQALSATCYGSARLSAMELPKDGRFGQSKRSTKKCLSWKKRFTNYVVRPLPSVMRPGQLPRSSKQCLSYHVNNANGIGCSPEVFMSSCILLGTD